MINNKVAVLIVEDDKDALASYAEIVSDAGFHAITAPDGYKGMQALTENKWNIEVVLLDLMMPGVDGLEVLSKIKGSPSEYGEPKVIVLSALSSETVVKEVFAKGADGYLLKSELEEQDIVNQIKKVLGQ